MSGLVALFHRDDRPVDESTLRAMLDAAPYRGPDGSTTRRFGPVGLGFAKMAISAEDVRERQPVVSVRTRCVIIADVRLDNRAAILEELPDRPSATVGDAELILWAYEAWGADALPRLIGDFALVLWDPRTQRLLCARDAMGQRHLFYRVDRRTFVAVSEIQQLFQDPTVPIEPNDARIRESLLPINRARNEKDSPETFYRGVFAVPAGHVLTVDRSHIQLRRFWDLQPPNELRYRRDEDYADHYRALFADVVRSHLRSVHPMGVLLSGGLDSASVTCVAQELFRGGAAADPGFTSFSLVYGDLDCDEGRLIRDVQAKYGFNAKYLPSTSAVGWLELEPRSFMEAPDMGVRSQRDAIGRAAATLGVRAILTGAIADTFLVGGPYVFDSLLRRGALRPLWSRLRAYRRTSRDRLHKIIALYCLEASLPLTLQRRLQALHLRRNFVHSKDWLLPWWMPEALRRELADAHVAASLAAVRARRFPNPVRQGIYEGLRPPETSRYPSPWGLEYWQPFADRRLHEFLLAIPPEQVFRPHPDSDSYYAASKWLARRAMRGIVPESIRTRTQKTAFDGVFEDDIRAQWPLFEAAFGPGAESRVVARGYVDGPRFWRRLEVLRDGFIGEDLSFVIHVIAMETWLRTFELPRSLLAAAPVTVVSGSQRSIAPVPAAGETAHVA